MSCPTQTAIDCERILHWSTSRALVIDSPPVASDYFFFFSSFFFFFLFFLVSDATVIKEGRDALGSGNSEIQITRGTKAAFTSPVAGKFPEFCPRAFCPCQPHQVNKWNGHASKAPAALIPARHRVHCEVIPATQDGNSSIVGQGMQRFLDKTLRDRTVAQVDVMVNPA